MDEYIIQLVVKNDIMFGLSNKGRVFKKTGLGAEMRWVLYLDAFLHE